VAAASRLNKLDCVGADGVHREFLWRVEKALFEEKWTFRVETQAATTSGDAFELAVELLEDRADTVRVIMMHHYGHPEYKAKGIPDALLPLVRQYLGKNVESSPSRGDTTGVYRTPAATRVWERLKAAGLADYDPKRDVYSLR